MPAPRSPATIVQEMTRALKASDEQQVRFLCISIWKQAECLGIADIHGLYDVLFGSCRHTSTSDSNHNPYLQLKDLHKLPIEMLASPCVRTATNAIRQESTMMMGLQVLHVLVHVDNHDSVFVECNRELTKNTISHLLRCQELLPGLLQALGSTNDRVVLASVGMVRYMCEQGTRQDIKAILQFPGDIISQMTSLCSRYLSTAITLPEVRLGVATANNTTTITGNDGGGASIVSGAQDQYTAVGIGITNNRADPRSSSLSHTIAALHAVTMASYATALVRRGLFALLPRWLSHVSATQVTLLLSLFLATVTDDDVRKLFDNLDDHAEIAMALGTTVELLNEMESWLHDNIIAPTSGPLPHCHPLRRSLTCSLAVQKILESLLDIDVKESSGLSQSMRPSKFSDNDHRCYGTAKIDECSSWGAGKGKVPTDVSQDASAIYPSQNRPPCSVLLRLRPCFPKPQMKSHIPSHCSGNASDDIDASGSEGYESAHTPDESSAYLWTGPTLTGDGDVCHRHNASQCSTQIIDGGFISINDQTVNNNLAVHVNENAINTAVSGPLGGRAGGLEKRGYWPQDLWSAAIAIIYRLLVLG